MSKRTRKEVLALVNQRYVFANFNVLMYAENWIFPQASKPDISDLNREELYDLYYVAHKLEPEPRHKELTFTQRMFVNRARKFITIRQRKRLAIRELKVEKKQKRKLKAFLSD